MYCEKCGAKNEDGSRFCMKCGAPLTSQTQPPALQNSVSRQTKSLSEQFDPSFKDFIIKGYSNPLEAVKMGGEKGLLKEGLLIFLVKDLLSGLMLSLGMPNMFSVMLHSQLMYIMMDAVWIFILLGVCKMFHGTASVSKWIGAMAGASILTGTMTVIANMFMKGSAIALIAGILFAVSGVLSVVLTVKTVEISMELHDNKLIYAILVAVTFASIAMFILYSIIIASLVQSQLGQTADMFNSMFRNYY